MQDTPVGPKVNGHADSDEGIGQVRFFEVPLSDLRPSPENDELYRPITANDPDVIALSNSIRERGILEPLVATADGFILSGHRRYKAAQVARLAKVPVRYLDIERGLGCGVEYLRLLREYNRQRVKSTDEILREEIVAIEPAEARTRLIAHRNRGKQEFDLQEVDMSRSMMRARLSPAKQPMLDAIRKVLKEYRRFLPIDVRKVHYELCQNHKPLKHASKPDSVYQNTLQDYKNLDDVLTRARVAGLIPMEAISDSTRPVTTWEVHDAVAPFIRQEVDGFLTGYWRDLMQSQPDHIELLVEKNTVFNIVREIAAKYTIPITAGRGYSSLPPRWQMARRFQESGKARLILLIASDFDPDGEAIAEAFPRSMRDDFGISDIVPIKFALTAEQARSSGLARGLDVKLKGSRAKGFLQKHGEAVACYELEALSADRLQDLTEEAIQSVIDVDSFDAEVERESEDAVEIDELRQRLFAATKGMRLEDGSG